MLYLRFTTIFIVVAIMAIFSGCSGETPSTTPVNSRGTLNNVPIIGLTESSGNFDALGLLGAYEITVDSNNLTVDLNGKRLSALGEDYIVSGAGFFTVRPCSDCLTFTGIVLNPDGNPTIAFNIRHPFNPGNPSLPPSAVNRLDLDVFDLAAVIVPSEATASTFALTGASAYTNTCINADGYTTELAQVITDPAAMPYFLVCDDSEAGTPTYNKFAMGDSRDFDISLNTKAGQVSFNIYLTMGYGASAKKLQRMNPKYYNPEFNRKAAWKVVVTPPQGTGTPAMGNTWNDADSTTQYPVTVKVYDWQIGANVDPTLVNPTDVYAASEVASVSVEIPGMNSALNTLTAASSGDGSPTSPLTYTFNIANENSLPIGVYKAIVKVSDSRPVLTPADGRDYIIDTPDGVQLNNYTLPEYATYQVFDAYVVQSCGPITGSITSPVCPVTAAGSGAMISFTASASSSNGGNPIVLYEWDKDYDGVTFDVDGTGSVALLGPFINTNCPSPTPPPMTYTVAVRAKDSCPNPNVTIFATCDVTVNSCATYQELNYDFTNCSTVGLTCGNWTGGGCGLSNTDTYDWGSFHFGCPATNTCGYTQYFITSGGDEGVCNYMTDHGSSANYNIVSPSITLPSASDSKFIFDHCNSMATTGTPTFKAYISTNGCTGPWTQIYTTSTQSGCFNDETINISSYSGSNVMFRFEYISANSQFGAGSCGNAGVLIDNVSINGTFGGTLLEN